MTTEDLIEKIRRYPIVVGSVAVLIVCFLAYYFRMDMLNELEVEHEDVSAKLLRIESNLVAGASLDEHLQEMRRHVLALDERVVNESDLAVNLKYFYQLESQTGVELADLRQSVNGATRLSAQSAYAGVGYNVILTGNYRQVIAYFDELENGSRIYRLNSFNLQRGRDADNSSLTLALNLDLLGWP